MQPQFIIRAVPTAYIVNVRLSRRAAAAHHSQTRERASVSDENSRLSPTRSQEIRRAMPFQLSLSV